MKASNPSTWSSPSCSLGVLGVLLGFGVGLGGCDADDQATFEAEAGALVCEWNRTCAPTLPNDSIFTSYSYPYSATSSCEAEFAEDREFCYGCDFNPGAAKRCIKNLEEALDTCNPEMDFSGCDKVYKSCDDCDIDQPWQWQCGVVDDSGPIPGLFTLGLIVLGIRRRWG
jgi:hypothetical protein